MTGWGVGAIIFDAVDVYVIISQQIKRKEVIKMPRTKKIADPRQMPLFEIMEKSDQKDEVYARVKALLNVKREGVWRGLLATPPGSFIEDVVREFEKKTDIPLEIPFFISFHALAGYLLRQEIKLQVGHNIIEPDIWTVVAGKSGSGKSFASSTITKAIPNYREDVELSMTGIASGAKFIEALSHQSRGNWTRDEYVEFYKKLERDSSYAEVKDYMLRLYSHDVLERETKKEGKIVVENAGVAMLGLCVLESLLNYVSDDDLINGFAQRYNYVIAERDPNRPGENYPIYQINTAMWGSKWEQMKKSIKHKTYKATEDGIYAFEACFGMFFKGSSVDESFMRRILWKAHSYALLYHIMTGDGEKEEVGEKAYSWSARAIYMHVADSAEILSRGSMGEFARKVQQTKDFIKRRRQEGKKTALRDIVMGVKAIKNTAEAKAILYMLTDNDNNLQI